MIHAATHPSKFSEPIMMELSRLLDTYEPARVIDPFAGTGRVHWLRTTKRMTVGVELEPEWATVEPNTIVGNALTLPFPDDTFDAVVTSPAYGNRMADHHNARDGSKRNTYRHNLKRELHPDNSGAMQWGPQYREFHTATWTEALRVLRADGLIFLNLSNHIRGGVEMHVTEWHLTCLFALGCTLLDFAQVLTRRQRQGAHGDLRVRAESIAVLQTKGHRP